MYIQVLLCRDRPARKIKNGVEKVYVCSDEFNVSAHRQPGKSSLGPQGRACSEEVSLEDVDISSWLIAQWGG